MAFGLQKEGLLMACDILDIGPSLGKRYFSWHLVGLALGKRCFSWYLVGPALGKC